MKIACLGDSITYYGSPSTAIPMPQRLQLLLDAAHGGGVHFVANHGKHSDLVTSGFGTRYNANIKGKGYDALIFLGGINDVAADVAAATIESAAQTILDDARTAGMKIVLIGMSPFAGDATDYTAARESVRTAVNTWYANYAVSWPASVSWIDTDSRLGNGASPPALQSQYAYLDGLHWLQPAVDLITPLDQSALGL